VKGTNKTKEANSCLPLFYPFSLTNQGKTGDGMLCQKMTQYFEALDFRANNK